MKIVFAFLVLICLLSQPAEACTCIATSPCASVWQASGIVEATVVAIEDSRAGELLVRLEGVRPIIGEPSDTVVTGADSAMCGYKFNVGTRYLIVMHRRQSDGRATTSICSPTQPVSSSRASVKDAAPPAPLRPRTSSALQARTSSAFHPSTSSAFHCQDFRE
jgi:hypothetical protein